MGRNAPGAEGLPGCIRVRPGVACASRGRLLRGGRQGKIRTGRPGAGPALLAAPEYNGAMTSEPVRKSILVAEDNTIQREGLAVILGLAGYRVVAASDGQDVLDQLRTPPGFDAIILDMLLPVRDGWSVLQEKNRDPAIAGVPVVILSALSIASPEWARDLGAAALLRKPVDAVPLLEVIRRLIGPG